MEQHQKPSESKENCINYFLLAVTHTIDDAFKAKQKLKTVCFKTTGREIILHQFAYVKVSQPSTQKRELNLETSNTYNTRKC